MPDLTPFTAYDDERGRLLPVELADVPFTTRRCFVVTSEDPAYGRGGHLAGCAQLMVLVTGSVVLRLTSATGALSVHELTVPGAQVLIAADDHVDYDLVSPHSCILVMADAEYCRDAQQRDGG